MCDFIEEQVENEDGTWKFRSIAGHTPPTERGPHKVLIEWESGEKTFEPIHYSSKVQLLVGSYLRLTGSYLRLT